MPRIRFRPLQQLFAAFIQAASTLDFSLNPRLTLQRLSKHPFTSRDLIYVFHIALATFWFTVMQSPPFPYKLLIPAAYSLALLIPLTSQFFLPATPIFSWVLAFYTSRFIPVQWRPPISVSTLPTLESVLYGTNISDILTRYTHPILDIIAWVPYGVLHFAAPALVAAAFWLFGPKPALKLWAKAFGYMNLIGVICQILFPCAAPWYELIHGLTPANYSMKGSPGGLARIDALFHTKTYTVGFSNAPVVFGAFPSLHSGCATIEALFISHFFPQLKRYAWGYTGVLYWATMYLTHHYLIDVVGGACLAVATFYFLLPDDLRDIAAPNQRTKYDIYGLEPPTRRDISLGGDSDLESEDDLDADITYRSPRIPTTPNSSVPLVRDSPRSATNKHHRHTASIASLIGAENRTEEVWGPIGARGFTKTKDPRAGNPSTV